MTTASSSLSTTKNSNPTWQRLTVALSTYRIWPVLILLLAGAALASGGIFLRPSNLVAILFVAAPTTIAALGQTLVIMTAGIDLSVAAVWVLSAVIAAGLADNGWSLSVSVLSSLCVGLAAGLVNGCLIAVLRVPPLITTLGTLSIGEGIARVYTGNSPILSVPPDYKALGDSYFGPVPLPTLILFTVVLLLVFIMHRMAIGKQIYAVGGNPVAARYAGLPVTATLIFVYAASGVLAALAGLIQSAYVQEALTKVDMDTLFATIGGVVVGGTALTGGSGRVINSVGGVLVIVVVENTMNILGVSPLLSEGVLGAIVLVAVYLNVGFNPQLVLTWLEAGAKPIPTKP
jgi:ribose transport system permease protein